MKEVTIDGKVYVEKNENEKINDGLVMCIVRTYSAGVFYGLVDYNNANGFNIEIRNAVRMWKWAGAFTLSNIAADGVSKPNECRFTIELPVIKVNRWIELIPISEKALKSLEKVKKE